MNYFILDIVNEPIELTEFEYTLLNTQTLRRLHYIRQLEFVSLVFPGCNHTRFEHTLGVTYLLKCVTENKQIVNDFLIPHIKKFLDDNGIEKFGINKEFVKVLLPLCGLVHDIGHGPFSHFSETVFELLGLHPPQIFDSGPIKMETFSNTKPLKLHEWIMCEVLTFEGCEKYKNYELKLSKSFKTSNGDSISNETLQRWCEFLKNKYHDIVEPIKTAAKYLKIKENQIGIFLRLIAYGACGKIPGIDSFIYGIFDLDRLDYLRRDSKMAGVKYGDVEVSRLLKTGLTFDKSDKSAPKEILIDYAKGIAALEHIYLGKEMLYSTTIFHPCSATARNMLLKFILDLPEVKNNNTTIDWNHLINFLIKIYSMEDPDFIEYLRDQLISEDLEDGHKSYLTKLLNRDLYKKIAVLHWTDLHPRIRKEIIDSSKKGFSLLWKKSIEYEKEIEKLLIKELNTHSFNKGREGATVIVNLPYYRKEWADIHEVTVRRKSIEDAFSYHQATEISPLLDASQKNMEKNKIVSVYLNPALFIIFKKSKNSILGHINKIFGAFPKDD